MGLAKNLLPSVGENPHLRTVIANIIWALDDIERRITHLENIHKGELWTMKDVNDVHKK